MRKLVISHKLTNRDSESFRQYLFEISNIDVFSSEEEFECATKSAAGDLKAREELIKRNLRFVVSVAKQYSNSVNHIEDLINEGNRGVIKAANHFDPTTGHKFITFAVWWIRKYITEYMEKHAKLVRLPANKVYGLSKLNRNIDLLEQKLGRTPDVSEIIEFCGSKDDGVDIRNLETINSVRFDSLDREVSFGNEGSITLGEMITNENSQSADHIVTSQGDSSDIKF
jgi:RNA polymerase primary sigma factor